MPTVNDQLADYLLTPAGRALIAESETLLAAGVDTLAALTRLRKTADPGHATAAWEQAGLRRRAAVKFGADASGMFFIREALEQASSARAAEYHAARFVEAGVTHVADLCGGIGGDAIAFARAGLRVTLYECDPARARFAAENARVRGLGERITVRMGDVTQAAIEADAAWFDPARREGGRRVASPDDYLPPLSFAASLPCGFVAAKVAPAVDHDVAGDIDADLEFLSDSGECKEALLWLGGFRAAGGVRATILHEGGRHTLTGVPDEGALPGSLAGRYLYEPDPAVIRAHLVGTLGRELNAAPVDPQIAYLLGDDLITTPFATAYEILDRFPFHQKALQRAITKRRIGSVIVKKRGFPKEPDEVRKSLRLAGPNRAIVVLTRQGPRHIVFLCRAVTDDRVDGGGDEVV
jgi:hypothetical protein